MSTADRPARRRTSAAPAGLAGNLSALGQPAEPAAARPGPMPAESSAKRFGGRGARITLELTPDQMRGLRMARAEDGTENNPRLRALVELYLTDTPRGLRARVDKLATEPRFGGRNNPSPR